MKNRKIKGVIFGVFVVMLVVVMVGGVLSEDDCGTPKGIYTFTNNAGTEMVKIGKTYPENWDDEEIKNPKLTPIMSITSNTEIKDESGLNNANPDEIFNNANSENNNQRARYLNQITPNLNINENAGLSEFCLKEVNGKYNLYYPTREIAIEDIMNNNLQVEISAKGNRLFWKFNDQKYWNSMETGKLTKDYINKKLQQELRAYSGGGGGSGVGGGSGSGIEQAFQSAMSIAKEMAGIFEGLKPKGKNGKTKVGVYENGVIGVEFSNGAEGAFVDNEKGLGMYAAQNSEKPAIVKEGDKKKKLEIENTQGVIPNQVAFSVEQPTELTLNGIKGNDPSNPPKTETSSQETLPGKESTPLTEIASTSFILPFFKLFIILPSVTAQAITEESSQTNSQGQYVKLIQHDIDISGRNIIIDTLKTFNKIQAGGQNLRLYSGDIQIKFQAQKTYYPRLIKKAPYGIAEISNKLDKKNKFKLQHYTNRKSQFKDNNERVSFSDVTVKHPRKNLIISKIRKGMWKEKIIN